MHRVISSMKTSTIHAQCISLCFLPFPSGLVLNEILLPVLWNSQVSVKAKEEAFKVISQLKIFSLVLVPGLYKTLSQADMIEKALEELHNQFQASRVSESDVEKIVVDGESVCTMLVEKLTELFEDPHEDIRLLSVKIIIDLLESLEIDSLNTPKAFEVHGKPMLNKYIAPEFEIKLIGDIRILTRKLVVLLLAEVEGTFKESAHLCLTKIKEKRPLAIAHECFEAKKSGFLKRWEYLDTLLSIPNSY